LKSQRLQELQVEKSHLGNQIYFRPLVTGASCNPTCNQPVTDCNLISSKLHFNDNAPQKSCEGDEFFACTIWRLENDPAIPEALKRPWARLQADLEAGDLSPVRRDEILLDGASLFDKGPRAGMTWAALALECDWSQDDLFGAAGLVWLMAGRALVSLGSRCYRLEGCDLRAWPETD